MQRHAKSQGTRSKGSSVTKEKPRHKQQTAAGKRQGPHAACGTVRGASNEDAAARDPPRVNSVLIRVYINGQELVALLDTACEVDLVSEETARRCNLPIHFLAQSLRHRFAAGRQNARIGKFTGVKCQFQSEMGTIDTVWDFYVGPMHHRRNPRNAVVDPMEGGHAASTSGHRGMRAGSRRESAPLSSPDDAHFLYVKLSMDPVKWSSGPCTPRTPATMCLRPRLRLRSAA